MDYNYPFFILRPPMTFEPPFLIFPNLGLNNFWISEEKSGQQSKNRQDTNSKDQESSLHEKQVLPKTNSLNQQFLKVSCEKASNQTPKPAHRKKRQIDSFTQKRNIIPNNINHILSYLQRKSKSGAIVEKIIEKFGQGRSNITSKKFYCYMGYLKQKLHVHVNRESLKEFLKHLDFNESIFTIQEQLFFNRVARIVIWHYLRESAKLQTLSSQRVKMTSKIDHLKAQRDLLEYMERPEDQS